MEIKIEDLVSSIKKDGIDAANEEAEKIIEEAKKKANDIINKAQNEQEKILKQTQNEMDTLKESARVSIMQAERDAVLLFEEAIKAKFERILESDINKTVDSELLSKLIKAALLDEDPKKYTVEVSKIEEGLKGELAKEIQDGLEIKINSSVKKGFRLNMKDGSGYFDCSDEEIKNMLLPLLPEINI